MSIYQIQAIQSILTYIQGFVQPFSFLPIHATMAAKLNTNTSLNVSSTPTPSPASRTITKKQLPIHPTVYRVIRDPPSQLLELTQPGMTDEEWHNYRVSVAQDNYKNMLNYREETIHNLNKFLRTKYYPLKKAYKHNDKVIDAQEEEIQRLMTKINKLKDRVLTLEYEKIPPRPIRNPDWVEKPIVIYLDDGEKGEEADRELDEQN